MYLVWFLGPSDKLGDLLFNNEDILKENFKYSEVKLIESKMALR
jgi:hypothetical protein